MTTYIASVTDIRTYVTNCNPAGILEEPTLIDPLVEAIRSADGRPVWGEDWSTWLDANVESLVQGLVVVA